MAPPIPVTEDTPPDMLAGSMDLSVMLPSGHSLKMSVERSTPMMDLLVQVTTANKMSPAGYIIQPLNEQGPLPYKPSTPIGALDAWTIHVVPKQNVHCTAVKKPLKILNQPFEQTFRLQVHLPRNQLYVARVSPRTRLADILLQVCSEKNLDPIKYSLRHPSNLDQVLRLSCTLGDYKLQEITLVCNRSHPVEVSSVDIMSLQRDTTNPAYRSTMCEGSVSSGSLEGRSLSPVPSDGSSASPPPLPPSRPIRKRRPAPKPPTLTQKVSEEKLQNGVQSSTVMYHSRNSSDSSGYHEASVLSESPQNHSITETLSRRKMESVSEADSATSLSKSMTDVTVIEPSLQQATSYNSITSLSSVPGRKKKTAAPPPPVPNNRTTSVTEDQQRTPSVSSTASSTTTLDGNEVKVAVKSATLPPSSRLNSVPKESSPPPSPVPAATVEVEPLPPTTPQEPDADNLDIRMADEEIDRIFMNATKNHISHHLEEEKMMSLPLLPSPPSSLIQNELKHPSNDDHLDWEYRLPAPPTFRDESKSPTVTEFGTITVGNLSDVLLTESVRQDNLYKPDLEQVVENKYEVKDYGGMNSTNINNKSSADTSRSSSVQEIKSELVDSGIEQTVLESAEQNVINELSNFIRIPYKLDTADVESKRLNRELSRSTLDNFTITTYKDKKPVEVFEDDSIKSSVGEKRDKSKDDAVFRAPKPRVKEPNLSRTSSFSMENKLNGPLIKRSVSYVSLLAANMPRHSQPYQALLGQQFGTARDLWPRLRKTSSEINIDNKDGMSGESPYPQDNTSELQSVQVLRNILSHSPANLTSSLESETDLQHSDPPNSVQRLEDTVDSSDGVIKFGRSQSEDNPVTWNPISKIQHSSSLDQDYPKSTSNIQRGVPNINLSTWNERPKRQISIKNDNDYTSGFGKKIVSQDETVVEERANAKVLQRLASSSRDPGQEEVKTLSQRFKLEGRSKSVTDLSRVPVVRAVELKKPFATHIFDQPLLKPISHVAESKSSSNNTKSENPNLLEQESNSDNTFIGVNSLARKFGVPNKRPVSMYGTSTSKNMQHESKEITKPLTSTFGNKEIFPGVVLQKTNERLEGLGEANTSEHHSKPNLTTSEIKAQAKISSGGFLIGDSSLSSPSTETPHVDKNADGLLGSNSQKYKEGTSREDAHPFNSSIENKNKDVPKTKVTATANDSSPSSPTQKVVSTGLYRQSQTLDRKTRPISLQPVVKGFRVSTEAPNSPKDKLSPLSPKTKDFITLPITVNSVKIPVSSTHKVSYQRALSTPVISTYSSMKINESAKEKIQDKVSSVPSTPTGTTKDITSVPPPPPPLMPILKPVSSRNIKLLPPPAAKPRDQLMLSIRSFSVDKLKPVSTQTKSSDNKKDLI
uniref:WH2 domain-containing protein n=1 Tax=Graphocephala atropunctata TaxID=36148 RepID=A0A1B6MAM0_9HEMI